MPATSVVCAPGEATPSAAAAATSDASAALRAHESVVRIHRWIRDAEFQKCVVPLAALAAGAAVEPSIPAVARIHARQRQLERDAELVPALRDRRFALAGERRRDLHRVRQA